MSNAKKQSRGSVFDMLAEVSAAENHDGSLKVALTDIAPDPNQPRKMFDPVALDNLAKSIKKLGIIQPITLRSSGMPMPQYYIVAGERRWQASKLANLVEIPAVLRDDLSDDAELRTIAQLAENMNRSDLSDFETAQAIQTLIDTSPDPTKHGLKTEIAEYLDRSRADISRLLKMLETENIALVTEGLIVSADALSRFRACDDDLQAQLIQDARAAGEPITSGTVRAVRAAQKVAIEAAATRQDPASDDLSGAAPAVALTGNSADDMAPPQTTTGAHHEGGSAGDTAARADAVQNPGEATRPEGHDHDELAGQGLAGGDLGTGNAFADSGDGDGDDDGAGDGDDAAGGGFASSGKSGSDAGSSSGSGGASGAPRAKSVSLQVTGEIVETLLRFLVDKSSDKLEVRLNADLAVGVIENLGGQLPENPDHYAQTIKDLLAGRMQ